MSSFSVFSTTKTEPWAATLPCFHCFDGGDQSMEEGGGGDLLCHPDLLPSVQSSPYICSSSTRKQHFSEIMSNPAIFRIKK